MDKRMEIIKNAITDHPDFPKKGVVFKDLFSVFANAEAFPVLMDVVKEGARRHKGEIDVVVGLDARGFLFGPIMALEIGVPFVPIRKAGKLPGNVIQTSYDLEYGSATVEVQTKAFQDKNARVLIVDDLLATGGTMKAACDLLTQLNIQPENISCFVIIELKFLNGREKLNASSVNSLITVD